MCLFCLCPISEKGREQVSVSTLAPFLGAVYKVHCSKVAHFLNYQLYYNNKLLSRKTEVECKLQSRCWLIDTCPFILQNTSLWQSAKCCCRCCSFLFFPFFGSILILCLFLLASAVCDRIGAQIMSHVSEPHRLYFGNQLNVCGYVYRSLPSFILSEC